MGVALDHVAEGLALHPKGKRHCEDKDQPERDACRQGKWKYVQSIVAITPSHATAIGVQV